MSRIWQLALVATLAWGSLSTASANPVFQGRLADGTASSTCTVSGAGKCAMFYDSDLKITILNDWFIGFGNWRANAAAGSAQALAASKGASETNFATGWVLPTGDGTQLAGALNQYLSIWNDVGGTFMALEAQFDGVQPAGYWSSTAYPDASGEAWRFNAFFGDSAHPPQRNLLNAVAVRSGDVADSVPEPQTLALVIVALGVGALARRRRPR